jgi:hypothetical protein
MPGMRHEREALRPLASNTRGRVQRIVTVESSPKRWDRRGDRACKFGPGRSANMAIVAAEFFAPSLAAHEDCGTIKMHIPRRRRFGHAPNAGWLMSPKGRKRSYRFLRAPSQA